MECYCLLHLCANVNNRVIHIAVHFTSRAMAKYESCARFYEARHCRDRKCSVEPCLKSSAFLGPAGYERGPESNVEPPHESLVLCTSDLRV